MFESLFTSIMYACEQGTLWQDCAHTQATEHFLSAYGNKFQNLRSGLIFESSGSFVWILLPIHVINLTFHRVQGMELIRHIFSSLNRAVTFAINWVKIPFFQ